MPFSKGLDEEDFVFGCLGHCQEGWRASGSCQIAFQVEYLFLSYLPHFVAKTERPDAPLPRSFRVCSLRDFAGDLEEGSLLCPVRAVCCYLSRTKSAVSRASSLFVSPRSSSCQISKECYIFIFYVRFFQEQALSVRVLAPRLELIVFAEFLPLRF